MEGLKELRSKRLQELLTEIGRELKPHDVEVLKNQEKLKERLPRPVFDGIDSQGKNSGSEFLKTLQEQGLVGDGNLELLKELLQDMQRQDLSEKLSQFEKKVKELGTKFSATRSLDLSTRIPVGSGLSDVACASSGSPPIKEPSPSTGLPLIEERIAAPVDVDRAFFEPLASDSKVLDSKYVKIDAKEGFHDLSSFGVLLQIPPNAVTRRTKILCVKLLPDLCSPAEKGETQVSQCVRIYSLPVAQLQKPIIVTLLHSGPSKKEGYETIVKAWKENQWKQIQELQEETPRAREHFKSGFIEVEIHEWTALAVVTRPIKDNFEVTSKGCVIRSSVCDDVTVEFPEGAVDETYIGAMKLLLMPDYIEILDGKAAYPCPMLLIEGFKGVSFNIPVKIRLPHPYPAGYPTGNVRVLTMDAPHEWKDITDEVHGVQNKSIIEVEVNHFCGVWVWICEALEGACKLASSLSKYLFKPPQEVFFAIFKDFNEVCSNISLTMTLACVPNEEQFPKIKKMKEEGYTKLASSTGNKKMRPDDKAYTKVEGCYKKNLEDDIFLQFIKDDICRKELPLDRKSGTEETSAETNSSINTKLVISFLEKKDDDTKNNLCKFCIDETKIVPKQSTETGLSSVVQIVGHASGSPGPSGLCSSASQPVDQPSWMSPACQADARGDLETCFGDNSIADIDSKEAASKVADLLKVNKQSMKDPPDEIVVKCRKLCFCLKSNERVDIVKELRELLPSGMTGPLGDGSVLVKDMDCDTKQKISRALSSKDEWKAFAQNLGLKADDIAFYDKREKDPVLAILNEHCKNKTVDELYDRIVKSGVNVVVDDYL